MLNSGFRAFAKCVVSNPKENVLWIGIPNPLQVAVEDYKCRNLSVSTNMGKLETTEENCSYVIYLDKPGKATITVADKRSNKKLGIMEFRVKYLPNPVAVVAGRNGGDVRKNVLMAQVGVVASLWGFDFDMRFVVTGFTVSILKDEKGVYRRKCEGNKFPHEVTEAFSSLKAGDIVIFSGMTYKGAATDGGLAPIEFKIVE